MQYIVEETRHNYGVIDTHDDFNIILNGILSKKNAQLIADILNAESECKEYQL